MVCAGGCKRIGETKPYSTSCGIERFGRTEDCEQDGLQQIFRFAGIPQNPQGDTEYHTIITIKEHVKRWRGGEQGPRGEPPDWNHGRNSIKRREGNRGHTALLIAS
jgi:hypothetical protein